MVKRAFIIIIIIIYVFSVFILCLFSLLYFCLFKKRSKYVALDFSTDFLIFIFYFVSSFEGEQNPTKKIQKKQKRSKYVALDFYADFLIFIFYFVLSFLLI
jgi:NADH:ubiquinone oxidoreductase subunit 6 (subunit J)